jgi:hypothetical protein
MYQCVAMRICTIGLAITVVACGSLESAAARDPMRCERDPSCAKARAAYADCTRQCNDDPECIDRCSQAQVDRPK